MIEAMAWGLTCVVNGEYEGICEEDLRPHAYGPITGKRGSILRTRDEALSRDVRIDVSDWVWKYSLVETKRKVVPFIRARLSDAGVRTLAQPGPQPDHMRQELTY